MIVAGIKGFLDWFCLEGRGYQFWSGIGLTMAWPAVFLWRHNCHVKRCWRFGHIDPRTHHPACRRHHSCRGLLGEAQR